MTGDVLGGGVIVVVAALLWLIYLVPTWSRQRAFDATERNAVRLSQTMRILAETAEVPTEVHLETRAREALSTRQMLAQAEEVARTEARLAVAAAKDAARAAKRDAKLRADADAARREAERAVERARLRETASRAAATAREALSPERRLRRTRAASSLVLLLSLGAVVAGGVLAAQGAGVLLLIVGSAGLAGAVSTLVVLAKAPVRVTAVAAEPTPAEPRRQRFVPLDIAPEPRRRGESWTPTPLPKPLHLSEGSAAATTVESVDATERLRRAAAVAAAEERAAARDAEQVAALAARRAAAERAERECAAASGPADSRFAGMGIVDDATPGMGDLNAVLRRRRASA